MAKSQYKLKFQKDGTTYVCDLYTTPEEARNNLYPGRYIRLQKNGTNLYLPLTEAVNSAEESTPLKVLKKGDPKQYYIAQHAFYRINITPIANAKITAVATDEGGQEIGRFTSGARWFPYGTSFSISAAGDPANTWSAPSVVVEKGQNTGNVLTVSNVEASACSTPARLSYTIRVNAVSIGQKLTLVYTQPGGTQETRTFTNSSAATISVLAGTTWTASLTADTGYTKGTLNASSGKVLSNIQITASVATLKTYTLKLAATSHQTITLKYKEAKPDGTYKAEVTKTSTSSAQNFIVTYGTTWTATVARASGYTAGTLSATKGTVKANTTVSATTAYKNPIITIRIELVMASSSNYGNGAGVVISYSDGGGNSASTSVQVHGVTTKTLQIKYNTKIKLTWKGYWEHWNDDESMYELRVGKFYVNYNGSRITRLSVDTSYTTPALTKDREYRCDDHD